MVSPLPNSGEPIAQVKDGQGFITGVWQRWFNQLTNSPAAAQSVSIGASPFSATAPSTGTVFVSGGTVSAIAVIRSGTVVPTGVTAGAIPVSVGDVVRVTYSVLPTVNFLPG